jgi:DNA-binding response OmpR family regulator
MGGAPDHNLRILVVDGYPDLAEIMATLLAIMGHHCRWVDRGDAALDQVLAFDPDLVLLDVGLPDLSGYEVARRLRSTDRSRVRYLAALTGSSAYEDLVRAHDAGFDQAILKPPDAKTLEAVVASARFELTIASPETLPPLRQVPRAALRGAGGDFLAGRPGGRSDAARGSIKS